MNISILLPLFNGEKFLKECVKSIEKQTYKNWKLYIGINGHGLNSELFNKWSKHFEDNTKIIVKEYDIKSKPQTLNLLAKECDSKFVALIDVDDKWDSKKLEKQMPLLNKYDVVGTAGRYFGEKDHRINIEVGEITYERIFFHNCFINSSVIMRREDVDFDDVFLDDYNMWLKMLPKKRKFYNVAEVLVFHRLHKESFFNGKNNGDVNKLKEKWLKKYGEEGVMMERFGTTVIMPLTSENYKSEHIKMSLDSVLKQTWPGYECLIVINNDKIVNMVKDIINKNYDNDEKKFLSIKKINDKSWKKNISPRMKKVKKRQYYNKCMSMGQYRLMAFIEPRDIWMPNKLFHQVFWIHGYDAICVGGEFYGSRKGLAKHIILPSRNPDAIKFYRSGVVLRRSKFRQYPEFYTGKTFLFHRHMNLIKVFFDLPRW